MAEDNESQKSELIIIQGDELKALQNPRDTFEHEVLLGLSETPKRLPSRHIYDDRGSELFEQIMHLKEYYPTASETEILTGHVESILDKVDQGPINIVDLGAGNGAKTKIVLQELDKRNADYRYVPIDISEKAIRMAAGILRKDLPDLRIEGLVCEYSDGLRWLAANHTDRRNLILFLGSNIGNFDRGSARAFLRRIWNGLRPNDWMLIGFDLKKDIGRLLSAYNDPEGVTARFNLNLLRRINNELGGNFDVRKFQHFATYDVFSGAMNSYLVSLEEQVVQIDAVQQTFSFAPWEPIHTEYSYKYLESDIDALASDTGFRIETSFHDEQRWFVDSLWRVEKIAV